MLDDVNDEETNTLILNIDLIDHKVRSQTFSVCTYQQLECKYTLNKEFGKQFISNQSKTPKNEKHIECLPLVLDDFK